jgi:hypothetical protein
MKVVLDFSQSIWVHHEQGHIYRLVGNPSGFEVFNKHDNMLATKCVLLGSYMALN